MSKKTTVDADIDQRDAGWEFDDSVAEKFDSHVRKSIPNYDSIQSEVVKITDWFVRSDDPGVVYDIGCATGTTLKLLAEHHRGSETRFIGIDVAEPMLAKARDRCEHESNVTLQNRDIRIDPQFPNASVVVSLFTLSFIPENDRKTLFERIYTDLDRGGALIFCEKTRADSAIYQDIWTEHYWDYKRSSGLSDDQILGKARTLRGQLRPLTIGEYETMLTDAGFSPDQIGLWYKWYPWAGFIARK